MKFVLWLLALAIFNVSVPRRGLMSFLPDLPKGTTLDWFRGESFSPPKGIDVISTGWSCQLGIAGKGNYRFSPPKGIDVISTLSGRRHRVASHSVSVPRRGLMSFLRSWCQSRHVPQLEVFQSPEGD
jgi:hypothetical protein